MDPVGHVGKLEEQQRQAALQLLRRLPPQDLEKNLGQLAKVAPHLETSLSASISKPSRIELDPQHNRYFLCNDFNRDGKSWRSPWSDKYIPAPAGGAAEDEKLFRPPQRLRRLEETFNEVFDAYKTSYYEGGVSSVYLWELDEGFAAAFLIRKELLTTRAVEKGIWDIIHIAEVKESTSYSEYKLYSTLLLELEVGTKSHGETDLGGYLTRTAEDRRKKVRDEDHIEYIGHLIEDTENSLRQSLDTFYMAKNREILNSIRSLDVAPPPQEEIKNTEKAKAKGEQDTDIPAAQNADPKGTEVTAEVAKEVMKDGEKKADTEVKAEVAKEAKDDGEQRADTEVKNDGELKADTELKTEVAKEAEAAPKA